MQFPVYRKYSNDESFFIIQSNENWVEYKRVGKKYLEYKFKAIQFPERNFIQDLLFLRGGIVESSEEDMKKTIFNG